MHFVTLVIGDDVDEKMAPYEEYLEGQLFRWYLEDDDDQTRIKSHPTDPSARCFYRLILGDESKHKTIYTDKAGYKYTLSPQNPNGYWDWYVIGGRWSRMLKIQPNGTGEYGLSDTPATEPKNFADQAKFGDIDWEYMRNGRNMKKKFTELWEMFMLPTDERPPDSILASIYPPEYYLWRYGDKDNFITIMSEFWTASVVTVDGQWHRSPASQEGERNWALGFWDNYLKHLEPDTLLTIVDCHI